MDSKQIRKIVSSLYWGLKQDYEQIDEKDLFYDVGMIVGYCQSINKPKLSSKMYDKFLPTALIESPNLCSSKKLLRASLLLDLTPGKKVGWS